MGNLLYGKTHGICHRLFRILPLYVSENPLKCDLNVENYSSKIEVQVLSHLHLYLFRTHMFTFWKCECLHIGHGNEDVQYTMVGIVQSTNVKEKDLGLTMNVDMKVSDQGGMAASKGIIGLIRGHTVYKEK